MTILTIGAIGVGHAGGVNAGIVDTTQITIAVAVIQAGHAGSIAVGFTVQATGAIFVGFATLNAAAAHTNFANAAMVVFHALVALSIGRIAVRTPAGAFDLAAINTADMIHAYPVTVAVGIVQALITGTIWRSLRIAVKILRTVPVRVATFHAFMGFADMPHGAVIVFHAAHAYAATGVAIALVLLNALGIIVTVELAAVVNAALVCFTGVIAGAFNADTVLAQAFVAQGAGGAIPVGGTASYAYVFNAQKAQVAIAGGLALYRAFFLVNHFGGVGIVGGITVNNNSIIGVTIRSSIIINGISGVAIGHHGIAVSVSFLVSIITVCYNLFWHAETTVAFKAAAAVFIALTRAHAHAFDALFPALTIGVFGAEAKGIILGGGAATAHRNGNDNRHNI